MRRIITTAALSLLLAMPAMAFGRYVHAAIATIAEQHLTKRAKANIEKVTGGRSIVYYASYPDTYKDNMIVDLGFKPIHGKRQSTLPHSWTFNTETGNPVPTIRLGDQYVVNTIYFIKEAVESLSDKAKYAQLTDSARVAKLCILVHMVGDMHCFGHVRLLPNDPERVAGSKYMTINGQETKYHTYLDDMAINSRYPWMPKDLAHIIDRFSAKEQKAIVAGGLDDWARDIYRCSEYARTIPGGTKLTADQCDKIRAGEEDSAAKAGYRLAKVLNQVFGHR